MDEATGTVAAFDAAAGYGTVIDDAGVDWFFHCTAIADGTRTIAEQARVRFRPVAGRLGRWEASDLRPLDAAER